MRAIFREKHQESSCTTYVVDDQVPDPGVGSTDIKIQVKACGLSKFKPAHDHVRNPTDLHIPVGQEVSGIVIEAGPGVDKFAKGDRVVGLLPLDSPCSGCAQMCVLSQYDAVALPGDVTFADAAAVVGDGLRAYTALHYQAHLCGGDTVLILDGATSPGLTAIQLAQAWGAKVMTTSSTEEEKFFLEELQPQLAHVIEIRHKNSILTSSVMEETGSLGVDVLIDDGVQLFTNEDDINMMRENYKHAVPSKHELISCLGVGGRWVTSHPNLQLDPPDGQQLFLKGASLSFLFEHTWLLSGAQYGRFQHMLQDIVEKLSKGVFKPNITQKVNLDNAVDVLQNMPDHRIGKIVVEL